MKTTIDIADALLTRAKREARRRGRPLRALVEDGLRRVLAESDAMPGYTLPDRSVGDPQCPNPLEAMSWSELRAAIYDDR